MRRCRFRRASRLPWSGVVSRPRSGRCRWDLPPRRGLRVGATVVASANGGLGFASGLTGFASLFLGVAGFGNTTPPLSGEATQTTLRRPPVVGFWRAGRRPTGSSNEVTLDKPQPTLRCWGWPQADADAAVYPRISALSRQRGRGYLYGSGFGPMILATHRSVFSVPVPFLLPQLRGRGLTAGRTAVESPGGVKGLSQRVTRGNARARSGNPRAGSNQVVVAVALLPPLSHGLLPLHSIIPWWMLFSLLGRWQTWQVRFSGRLPRASRHLDTPDPSGVPVAVRVPAPGAKQSPPRWTYRRDGSPTATVLALTGWRRLPVPSTL